MWRCSNCSEVHEESFDACWNCGSSKEKGETVSDELYSSPDDLETLNTEIETAWILKTNLFFLTPVFIIVFSLRVVFGDTRGINDFVEELEIWLWCFGAFYLLGLVILIYAVKHNTNRQKWAGRILFPKSPRTITKEELIIEYKQRTIRIIDYPRQRHYTRFGVVKSWPWTSVFVSSRHSLDLLLTREGAVTAIGKSVGLMQEISVDDSDLDDKFLIMSTDKENAKKLLSDKDIKNTLLDIDCEESGFFSLGTLSEKAAKDPKARNLFMKMVRGHARGSPGVVLVRKHALDVLDDQFEVERLRLQIERLIRLAERLESVAD